MGGKRIVVGQAWDFYPCEVDGRAASIFLNLWFEDNLPLPAADTMYCVRIAMRDTAEHGMGSAAEAEVLRPLEDRLIARAQQLGLFYVGRLRNHGTWELVLYGPPDRLDSVRAFVGRLDGLDGRAVETDAEPDPSWDYYTDFLLPDDERRQWMQDRRLTETLEAEGDQASVGRRVDHRLCFSSELGRSGFVRAVAREGFVADHQFQHPDPAHPFGLQVHRIDTVDLDHIHDVVMQLFEQANHHGGAYDGWETSVEKP